MMRIACVGEAMIELAMTTPPKVGVAGDTLNTAVYLKRAAPELEVSYVTRLGDEPFSNRIRSTIQSYGLGTDRIDTDPTRACGLYAIDTSDAGERSFTYWRSESAARRLFAGPDFKALNGVDAVYTSAITLAILPEVIRVAWLAWLTSKPEITLAFDSNYRPRLWASRAEAQETIAAWWARADVLLPSMEDEQELTRESGDAVQARFLALRKPGALKCSADGPISLGPDPVAAASYPPAARVVDTTAAGDSFNGAYLAALWSGGSQADALAAGHACAARVVGFSGAIVPEDAA